MYDRGCLVRSAAITSTYYVLHAKMYAGLELSLVLSLVWQWERIHFKGKM